MLRIELVHGYHDMRAVLAGGVQLPPAVLKLPWIGDQLRDLTARIAQDPQALGFELRKLSDRSFDQIARVIGDISRNAVKLAFAVFSCSSSTATGRASPRSVTRALEQVLGPRVDNYLAPSVRR